MPEEKKTYLVDVKSNLEQYIEELAKTRAEVERLTIEQLKLTGAQEKNYDEIEKINSELRVAQKEYSNAKKNIDLVTSANKAQQGSYQQLYKSWQLAQTQLKLMEGTLKRNADGTYILTDRYIKQKREVENAKRALDAFGKGIADNRLNVGNYSEAIQGALSGLTAMPGATGKAAQAIQGFSGVITRIMGAGGLGALFAGIGVLLSGLAAPVISFFKNTNDGIELMERKMSGLRTAFAVVKGRLADLGKTMVESVNKPTEEQGVYVKTLKSAWDGVKNTFSNIFQIGTTFFPGVRKWFKDFGDDIKSAQEAGEAWMAMEQAIDDQERAMIVPRAERIKQIREARNLYMDSTKTLDERMKGLETALNTEADLTEKELALQSLRVANIRLINDEKEKQGLLLDEDRERLEQAIAREIELVAESAGRQLRLTRALANGKRELLAEQLKIIAAEEKIKQITATSNIETLKLSQAVLKNTYSEILDTEKLTYEEREKLREDFDRLMLAYDKQIEEELYKSAQLKRDLALKEIDTRIQDEKLSAAQRLQIEREYQAEVAKIAQDYLFKEDESKTKELKTKRDEQIARQKAGFEADRQENENAIQNRNEYFDNLQDIMLREQAAERNSVEFYGKSAEEKRKIEANWTKAFIALTEARMEYSIQEAKALSGALGDLASQFAEHTAAYKLLSVAQATIAVYTAAAQAMASWEKFTVVQKIAAAASILATGLGLINTIKSVSTSGSSSPQAISSGAAAQRAIAPTVGATIINQAQLSPIQAQSLPSASALTADEIALAISKLPSPIVTVEDINIRAASKYKVEVRANI